MILRILARNKVWSLLMANMRGLASLFPILRNHRPHGESCDPCVALASALAILLIACMCGARDSSSLARPPHRTIFSPASAS